MTKSVHKMSQYEQVSSRKLSNTRTIFAVLVGIVLAVFRVGATGIDEDIISVEKEWEFIRYEVIPAEREKRFEALAATAHKLGMLNPGRAEPLIWEGIAISSAAGEKGNLGALMLVKQAKTLLEESIRIDSTALDGAALYSLGALYYKVPAWPVGFGDKSRAAELLLKSLAINPQGVDNNFFYGEFLIESGHPEAAAPFLERALNVPARPGRQNADFGRREEIRQLLEKTHRR